MPNAPVSAGSSALLAPASCRKAWKSQRRLALRRRPSHAQVSARLEAAVVDHLESVVAEAERQLGGADGVVGVLDELVGQGSGAAEVLEGARDRLDVIKAARQVVVFEVL
jgi:hypothetical protein